MVCCILESWILYQNRWDVLEGPLPEIETVSKATHYLILTAYSPATPCKSNPALVTLVYSSILCLSCIPRGSTRLEERRLWLFSVSEERVFYIYWEDQRSILYPGELPWLLVLSRWGVFVLLFVFQGWLEQHDHHVPLWSLWEIG